VTLSWLVMVPPAVSVRVVGVRVGLTPEGAPVTVSETLPLQPAMLAAAMLSVALDPASMARLLGCVDRRKVGDPLTVLGIVTNCWNAPLFPVTVSE